MPQQHIRAGAKAPGANGFGVDLDNQVTDEQMEQGSLFGPGMRLREAREKAGLTLEQLSRETRITVRHLQMLENGDLAGLPARTYATGFARSYAKQVGLDDNAIAAEVRAALNEMGSDGVRRTISTFEPADPARVPSALLGWIAALGAIALLAVGFIFFRNLLVAPVAELPSLEQPAPPAQAPSSPAAPAATPSALPAGPVIFTALRDGVWVKFYDGEGRQLMQKEMARGERYVVPADAQSPQLWTARPDALAITVGGRSVPPLSETQRVMKDVAVSAQALSQRGQDRGVSPASSASNPARPADTNRSPTD